MHRAWVIALCSLTTSCIWISSERESERLDRDGDGVPLAVDCNDDAAATSALATTGSFPPEDPEDPEDPVPPGDTGASSTGGTADTGSDVQVSTGVLGCNSGADGVFDIVCEPDDPRPICDGIPAANYLGEALLDILPCRHPGFTDRLVQVGSLQGIHRVEVDTPTDVQVFLTIDPQVFPGDLAVPEEHPYAALVANRGRSCSEATCVLGTPLLDGEDVASTDPYTVSFTALPGEPWYVIASGPSGSYRVDVRCGEAEL